MPRFLDWVNGPRDWGAWVQNRWDPWMQQLVTALRSEITDQGVWSPLITQGGNVGRTVNEGAYVVRGGFLFGNMLATVSGTGTAANNVTVSLPVDPAVVPLAQTVGTGFLTDVSAGATYNFQGYRSTTTTATLLRTAAEGAAVFLGSSGFVAALGSGDIITMQISYRVD